MPPDTAPGREPDRSRPQGTDPGQARQAGPEPDRSVLAAQALARARADALARGARPGAAAEHVSPKENSGASSPAAGLPGGRERREDPAPLAAAIDDMIAETGWELAVATGSVFGRWAQIVGADLAAHTAPEGLSGGELTVTADSTAWATQVRLLAAELIRALNAELGAGTVRRVRVRGPGTQPRRRGEWRVRGARGPRDTYG